MVNDPPQPCLDVLSVLLDFNFFLNEDIFSFLKNNFRNCIHTPYLFMKNGMGIYVFSAANSTKYVNYVLLR